MTEDILVIDRAVDVIPEGDDAMRFVLPGGRFLMRDPFGLVKDVTEQCRAGATRDGIAATYSNQPRREAALLLIETLKQRRVLSTELSQGADPLIDWVRHFAGSRDVTLPEIEICGHGALGKSLQLRINRLGFKRPSKRQTRACLVAAVDHPDMTWLREKNRSAFLEKRPFLPIWLDRSAMNWGPMTVPDATGCLECLWHRQQAAQRLTMPAPRCDAPLSSSATLAEFTSILASTELLRWALKAHVETEAGTAWRFDMLTMEFSGTKVLKLPRCPVCGTAS